MRKQRILAVLIGTIFVCISSFGVAAESADLIDNGDFENGIENFGICYSSKEDTVMPALRISNTISKDGRALEFIPGETLTVQTSKSPVSVGFAYQGTYNKNSFNAEKGTKYKISADTYATGIDVKMRFIVVADNRAIATSEELSVLADRWSSNTFSWVSNVDVEGVKIRIAFYDIEYGKSVYIDNFACNEAIVNNKAWQPMDTEKITFEGEDISFTTASGQESGIYSIIDSSKYVNSEKYGLIGTVSTDAEKAYISITANNAGKDYMIKKEENVKFIVPFEVSNGEDVTFNITALTENASAITLDGLEVVDKYSVVDVEREDNNLTVSGILREGNENEQISVQIGEIGTFNVTTNSSGEYSFTQELPDISEPQKKIRISVSNIRGYSDVGGVLSTDYILTNNDYTDNIATQVSGKNKVQVKAVLTEEVLDNLGVSVISAFRTADKDDIFEYIAEKEMADGQRLIDDITTAAALSSLDAKTQSLCAVTDKYSELLGADKIAAYNDIYKIADKSTLNSMFVQCEHKINNLDSYKYALTETLVRYMMKSEVNYSQQIELLQKYADDLELDFTEYKKLTSAKQYSVAASLLIDIQKRTDYSNIQDELDKLVAAAKQAATENSGGNSGGTGGGGRVGISASATDETVTQQQQDYRFRDLESHQWAQKSIYALVEKGVISKPTDKLFNPENNVTRAEMAKMTAVLFGYDEYIGNVEKFEDVLINDWYYQYVMALYEDEVVYGISENLFGSDNPITRQDICVIFERLLDKKADNTEVEFTDIDDAGDYATDAIRLMKSLGIINGYEDGSFRPNEFATRAEISQILYKISNL